MQKIEISGNVYQEIEKGILRLEKCKVNEDILSIPSEIFYKSTKYKISEIGDKVFSDCKELKFIKIPSSVESIGDSCFFGSNVETVEIENNSKLQTIGEYAFSDCEQLKFIKIPSSVESIGKYCFSGSNVETVEIENNSKLQKI